MEISKRLPMWFWWAVGIMLIAAIAAAAVLLTRSTGPTLPPGLVERRAEAARILDEASRVEDADLKPLVALEARKDFKGAVALMEQAMAANERQERLNASLITVSEELTRLAVGVTPDEVGARAVDAFSILTQLAGAEKKFFAERRQLYETTRNYYAELAAKKKPSIPADLSSLVDRVSAALAKARELHRRFTDAVKAFDAAIRK